MAYLGRPGAVAPLTSADIPDNSITAAKIVDATIAAGDLANDVVIDTSGAITTTGTATFSGDLVPSTPLSHRNMIINGGMQVWQRATGGPDATCDVTAWSSTVTMDSTANIRVGMLVTGAGIVAGTTVASIHNTINTQFTLSQDANASGTNVTLTFATAVTSGYYTVDRWAMYENSGATVTSEKHTMSVTELNTTGHRTALKLNCTVADTSVAAGDYIFIRTSLEGQDLQQLQYGSANAKDITLSFWVKSDKTGVYSVVLNKNSETRTQIPLEYTISSADTWEKKTITVTPTMGSTNLIAVAAGVIDNDNNAGLAINFTLMVGDTNEATADTWVASSTAWGTNAQVNWANETNNFYLTGVQLELGSSATPFEHRSYTDELARCQRYCYKAYAEDVGTEAVGCGYWYVNNGAIIYVHLPVTMSKWPSVTTTANDWYCSYGTNSHTTGVVAYNDADIGDRGPVSVVGVRFGSMDGSSATAGHAAAILAKHTNTDLFLINEL